MKNRIRILLLILVFFAFNVKQLYSQNVQMDTIFSLSIEELMKVRVVSSTKLKDTYFSSPSSIIVITDKTIKERGYHHLEEIFHDLPGFNFNKAFGDEYSTIFMRGLRTGNTDGFIMIYDGVIQNDIWKKSLWISRQYPVTNIKRIEVLYGPSSALWGTHAFSGIINIIIKNPEEMGNNVTVSGGSYGTRNFEYSTGNKLNDQFSYTLTIKYLDAQKLHPWAFTKLKFPNNFSKTYLDSLDKPLALLDGRLQQIKTNDDKPYSDYGLHAAIYFGKQTKFSFINWVKNETDGYWFNPFLRTGKYTEWITSQMGFNIEHTANPTEKISIKSTASHRIHQLLQSREIRQQFYSAINPNDLYNTASIKHNDVSTYLLKYDPAFGYGVIQYHNLRAWDASMQEQVNYTFNEKLNIIGEGLFTYTNTQEDYNIGNTTESIINSPRHNRTKLNAALQFDYKPFPNFRAIIGGRYEQGKNDFISGYEILIPRASLVYTFNEFALRLQYAEAYREPSDFQLFSVGTARPYPSLKLMPEQNRTIETGISYNHKNKMYVSSAIYYTQLKNFIIPNPEFNISNLTPGTPFWTNNKFKSKIYGFECYAAFELTKEFSLQGFISGSFNYSDLQKVNDQNKLVVDAAGNPVIEKNVLFGDMAPIDLSLTFAYKWRNKVSILPKINYVSTKKTINYRLNPEVDPIVNSIKGYAILGLNVSYSNIVKGLDFNIKVDNLLNTEYYNPGIRTADGVTYNAKVLQPGINFMTGFTYNF